MNLEEIRTLLQAYDLGRAPLAIHPINKGMENENYRVETPTGQYVLRVYSLVHATTGPRTPAEIAFELDWVDHLRRRKVPTPALIRTRAGAVDRSGALYTRAIINKQMRYAALFEFAAGEEAQAYTPEKARSVAEVLLQIRKALPGFQYTTIRPWPGDIIRLSLEFYRKQRSQHPPQAARYQLVLDRLYEEAVEGYRRVRAARLPVGVVHGDIKLENLLFAGDQVTAVLDFDDYRESYLLEELTRTVMHDLDSPTRNAIRAGCFSIFQQVFASDPAISAAELPHLPTFLKARFLYDLSAYWRDGNEALVDVLFADPQIRMVILGSGYEPF